MDNLKHLKRTVSDLLSLAHELGRPENRLVVLSEGNVSAAVDRESFFVKASGYSLADMRESHIVQVDTDRILSMLDRGPGDEEIDRALMEARVNSDSPRPSVETLFHAWLLTRPGVDFVAHTHPQEVNSILCSGRAAEFAENRLFPDQIVCCGKKDLLIDYADPGLELAAALRDGWERFEADNGCGPKVVLVKNHGLIVAGATSRGVLSTTMMTAKAAEIFLGAVSCGGPVFLSSGKTGRIATRRDEHYRGSILLAE